MDDSWRRAIGSAASLVDRAFAAVIHAGSAHARAAAFALSHSERLAALAAIEAEYGDAEVIGEPEAFFPVAPIDPTLRLVRPGVWDAHWPSGYVPFSRARASATSGSSMFAERYLAAVENRTARARVFSKGQRRPAVILVHGYMGGHFVLEEAQWPIRWLQRRGLDVVLALLPFHGLRAGARRGPPQFPSVDPRMTIEGFRQSVMDLRGLARFLRARGAPAVGVMGVSLGAYTSALLATSSGDIDFLMLLTPLASIADFAREQGQLGGDPVEAAAVHAALERAQRAVSPLARPSRVLPSRALVVAAEFDRVTPSSHAERLAAHFGAELVRFPGAHLVQVGRSDAFRALSGMLEREGIVKRR